MYISASMITVSGGIGFLRRSIGPLVSNLKIGSQCRLGSLTLCKEQSCYIQTSSAINSSSRTAYVYPLPTVESRPDGLKKRLTAFITQYGFIPNIAMSVSTWPDHGIALIDYYTLLMKNKGNLTEMEKELIFTAVSAENRCVFCTVCHAALHRNLSHDKQISDQVAVNWRDAELNSRQHDILDFAMKVCHCQPLTDADFRKLEEHGLTMDDAWEIGNAAAYMSMNNRRAILLGLIPNEEYHTLGRK